MKVNKKILLVDDDVFVSQAYEHFLAQEGFEVVVGRNGNEALFLVDSEKPDLMLLDLIMPERNGFDVLKVLKKKGTLKKLPVIVISNLGQISDIEACRKLGAVNYLIKSNFYLADVIKKIKYHLRHPEEHRIEKQKV